MKKSFKLWNLSHKPQKKEPEMLEITKQYIAYLVNSNN
jgi:hypothetical protein